MKLLIIESFYTGSHKQWLDGLCRNVDLDITTLTLDGKLWKWRMEASAYKIAEKYLALNQDFDRILFSGFYNLALFKSLLFKAKQRSIPPCYLYMHENQISYPWSETDPDTALKRDRHYGFIDLMNSLLADKLIFNSKFHKRSFLDALPDFCDQFPEDYFSRDFEGIRKKSLVLPIGLDLEQFVVEDKEDNQVPVILWNHRWEYDKNPELFFNTLFELKEQGEKFKLIVLGERYRNSPEIFNRVSQLLRDELLHFGFVKSRDDYISLLKQADLIPVTSKHDFFGISVVEGIAASCIPLLPNSLAYPEHISLEKYPELFYHNDEDYLPTLSKLMRNYKQYKNTAASVMKYDWEQVKYLYSEVLSSVSVS